MWLKRGPCESRLKWRLTTEGKGSYSLREGFDDGDVLEEIQCAARGRQLCSEGRQVATEQKDGKVKRTEEQEKTYGKAGRDISNSRVSG